MVTEYWKRFVESKTTPSLDADTLSSLAIRWAGILRENPVMAEVGSATGESTLVIARAILPYHGNVVAIDHWSPDTYSIFKQRMLEGKVSDIVHPLQISSELACQIFKDGVFDMVFLNRYEGVNIVSWLNKVRAGGNIAGKIINSTQMEALNRCFSGVYTVKGIWAGNITSKRDELMKKHPEVFIQERQWNNKGRDIILNMLLDMKEIFDSKGIKFWLCFGTFLGIYRDGDLIPQDRAIDLAVYSEDTGRIESYANLFAEKGITFIPRPDSLLYKDGEHIDFFPWRLRDDKRIWGTYNIDATDFETPNWVDFLGERCRMLSHPEKWLEHIYGPDWRTPKKGVHALSEGPAYEV